MAAEAFPAAQSVQTDAPELLYDPAVHEEQVFAAVAPITAEYFPDAQLVQADTGPTEYLPAMQRVHIEAPVFKSLNDPARQSAHAEAPAESEKVPILQSAHTEAEVPPVLP
jgi:hypothetical protein